MKTSCGLRTLIAKSCSHCHELKLAKHFPKQGSGYYTSHCNDCKNKLGKPGQYRKQKVTRNAAEKHRQPWREEDLDKLSEMLSEGSSAVEMALSLERSIYSINTMVYKMKRGIV